MTRLDSDLELYFSDVAVFTDHVLVSSECNAGSIHRRSGSSYDHIHALYNCASFGCTFMRIDEAGIGPCLN